MRTVREIERAIETLSEDEVVEIRAWLWEMDIERDVAAGRLDSIARQAVEEHRLGKTREL